MLPREVPTLPPTEFALDLQAQPFCTKQSIPTRQSNQLIAELYRLRNPFLKLRQWSIRPTRTTQPTLSPYATSHPPMKRSNQHQLHHHTQPYYHSQLSQSALHPSTGLPTLPKPYVGEQSYASLHYPASTEPTHHYIQPTTLANLDTSTTLGWRYEPQ